MVTHAAPRRSMPTAAIIAVLCICGTVVSLQQTLVIPLLPDFPKLLGTTADNASWLVTITLLTSAVGTPIVARLADMFGKRLMMTVCLVAVVVGSVLGALADSLATVVTARGLQGVGAALIPVGISIMRDELPGEKVGGAVALMSATLGIGGAVGMPMAGVIYEHLTWHWLFWVSAAFGALMLVLVLLIVPESKVRSRGRFDYLGAVLLSLALTALLLAISKGGTWGWTSERTLGLLLVAALLVAVWLPVELRTGQPLVDLRTSARRPVLLTNLASVLIGFAMFGNMLATTQQLQMPAITGYGFEMTVVAAGLAMLPGGIAMVLFAPVSATITRRWGAKTTLITGALVIAGGYVGRVYLTDEIWHVVLGSTIVSVGTAIAYAAMPTLIMRSVPITETASANGLNTLLRAIGTSTSSAAVAAILTSTTMRIGPVTLPRLDAFQHGFWLDALAALLGVGVALGLPRRTPVAAPAPAARPAATRYDLKPEGRQDELVVRGTVVGDEDQPIRHAVVSILRTDGEHVDWSRADNDGTFSVVLPGAGRYVVVCSADGWAPDSGIMELGATATGQRLRLSQRLTLSGAVTADGTAVPGALVSLTQHSGESVASVRTDEAGRYRMPLPPAGRYVLTVVELREQRTVSRPVLVATQSAGVDVELRPAGEVVAR